MTYVDFAELKKSVPIDRVFSLLNLKLRQHGDQWRGACPICHQGGERALVVTVAKGCFYCFSHGKGGDMIALVAETRGIAPREAATLIAQHTGALRDTVPPSPTSKEGTGQSGAPGSPPAAPALKPLEYLIPDHDTLASLAIAPETFITFGAGYAPKGIIRGRLAMPIHDRSGALLAYCGRTLKDESPVLIFPNGFDPRLHIFNADRIAAGDLFLVRDPLCVLTAFEAGLTNVVAFLTESIGPQQLEQLASLMDERQCESVELF
jgi:DNA primase